MSLHGTLIKGWLVKRGGQVQKFWKFNGYGVAEKDLKDVKGVVLYTTYDGILWATVKEILAKGKPYRFSQQSESVEAQFVLPANEWHRK